jgi:magnesium-transporting ATPase (P-type)
MRYAMASFILSLATLVAFALLWGAWRLWKTNGFGQKLWLMIAAALVIFTNIAIWTIPDKNGNSLVSAKRDYGGDPN